ncbi:NADH-quinone oxidoreductase subunit J [Prochlorothrix hollandica]|uniref:NADH-quinone oxidoreductase subunit J n=1 Tax=Prochlorothrix hollandica TaxID=1223 RepID=UPI0003777BF3|nr:NADH-quinone oxidoreductase subunit J [Prochlorothrix hollandica]
MNLAEGVQLASFVTLAALMLLAALGVVLSSNIVYSAFLLGGVFMTISGLYLLLNASFVAAAQLLIYVGAVNVLILFAIMLVNKGEQFKPLPYMWLRRGVTAFVCGGLFVLLSTMVITTPWSLSTGIPIGDGAIYVIAQHFFSDFLLPFELASVLLLVALIGAIVLARREFFGELPNVLESTDDLRLPERPRELVGSGKD